MRLRQPLIVAFIGVGVLVGPVGTGWVEADTTIELLARMGIAIFLFLVGLRLEVQFERTPTIPAEPPGQNTEVEVIRYGLGRFGSHLAEQLNQTGHRFLAVDFDPHAVATATRAGTRTVFGSADDPHLLEVLPLAQARYVISAIPLLDTNLTLLHNLRHHNYQGMIALTAHARHDADHLRAAGADTVLDPFAIAANATTHTLRNLLVTDTSRRYVQPLQRSVEIHARTVLGRVVTDHLRQIQQPAPGPEQPERRGQCLLRLR